jgi:vacuolar-type H+-ATPase subunit I/STV1
LLAQLLIAASFAIASYEDVRERAVNDLVWLPALAGAGYVAYSMLTSGGPTLGLLLVKLGLVGGIALVFLYFGSIGQADAIAMAFVASDPYPLSPILPLVAAAAIALTHIGYEFVSGNARGGLRVPIERFLKEPKWIPKAIVIDGVRTEVSSDVNAAREEVEVKQVSGAMVEVGYGVPTVAYLGVGYVAYLAYLIVFNPLAFAGLP